jgi:hypothetical protein
MAQHDLGQSSERGVTSTESEVQIRMARQGMLFKQIKESELTELPWQVLLDYAGYKRGIETFVKIIERENRRLPGEFDETSEVLWNCKIDYKTENLEMLMWMIGRMKSERSFEVLMNFATGNYHPYVRCEAVYGLTNVLGHQRELREMALEKLRSPKHRLDLYSGIMIFDHCYYRFRAGPVIEVLKPFLNHPIYGLRMHAANGISHWDVGKEFLREYLKTLTLDGSSEHDRYLAVQIEKMIAPDW